MNGLHQQTLAETGAGVGLVILKSGAVGLGIAAVDDAANSFAWFKSLRLITPGNKKARIGASVFLFIAVRSVISFSMGSTLSRPGTTP